MVECEYCEKETSHDSNHKACLEEFNERDGAMFTCIWCGEELYEHQVRAGLEEHPECGKDHKFTNFPGHD